MSKQNKGYLRVAIVMIIIVGAGSYFLSGSSVFKNYTCEKRGGELVGPDKQECFPKDVKLAAAKNLKGNTITIPNKNEEIVKLEFKDDNYVSGDLKNTTGKIGQVLIDTNRVEAFLNGDSFLSPIQVNYQNADNALYLGAFQFEGGDISKINFLGGYLVVAGDKYLVDKISAELGPYFHVISVVYHQENDSNNQRTAVIHLNTEDAKFYAGKNCSEIVNTETRVRGDNKEYEVCVWGSGKECAVSAYKQGACPLDGIEVANLSEVDKYLKIHGILLPDGRFVTDPERSDCDQEKIYNGLCPTIPFLGQAIGY